MYELIEKSKEKNDFVVGSIVQKKSNIKKDYEVVDNRLKTVATSVVQKMRGKISGPVNSLIPDTKATAILYQNGIEVAKGVGDNGPWYGEMPQWIKDTLDSRRPDAQKNKASGDAELHSLVDLEENLNSNSIDLSDGAIYTMRMSASREECSSCTARILRWCNYYGIARIP